MQPAKLPSEYRSNQWSIVSRSISIVTGKIYEHKNRQGLFVCSIIESVDSNVGIAWTRNIWQYKKISQNLKNGQLISLYNNVPFIFECFHDQQYSQLCKKASQKYHTKNPQNGPNKVGMITLNSQVYKPPTYLFYVIQYYGKRSLQGVIYLTVFM